jgi:hypothetical protein
MARRGPHRAGEAIPIIWYSPIEKLPVVIRYLPLGQVEGNLLPEEWDEVEKLKSIALLEYEKYAMLPLLEPGLPAPVLTGPHGLQKLHNAGNRWLNKCIHLQDQEIPLPDFFIKLT